MTRLRWVFFNRLHILEINPQMDSVKASLVLIMTLVIFEELLRSEGQTEETRTKTQVSEPLVTISNAIIG